MKRWKVKNIEAKAQLGLPLTDQEKAYYVVFSRVISKAVVDGTANI